VGDASLQTGSVTVQRTVDEFLAQKVDLSGVHCGNRVESFDFLVGNFDYLIETIGNAQLIQPEWIFHFGVFHFGVETISIIAALNFIITALNFLVLVLVLVSLVDEVAVILLSNSFSMSALP
jgi:hypothetical protein